MQEAGQQPGSISLSKLQLNTGMFACDQGNTFVCALRDYAGPYSTDDNAEDTAHPYITQTKAVAASLVFPLHALCSTTLNFWYKHFAAHSRNQMHQKPGSYHFAFNFYAVRSRVSDATELGPDSTAPGKINAGRKSPDKSTIMFRLLTMNCRG